MLNMFKKRDIVKEVGELDVSFVLGKMGTISNKSIEIKLLSSYTLRDKDINTIASYEKFLIDFLYKGDKIAFREVKRNNSHMVNMYRIKNTIDSLIYKEFGYNVIDARFDSFTVINREKLIMKLNIWILKT